MGRIDNDVLPATGEHPPVWVPSANFLGIIDNNVLGKNRTRPQRCGQLKRAMVIFDLAITPEWDNLPVQSSQSEEENGFWTLVEIEGKVISGTGYARQSQRVGLDTRVFIGLS